MSSKNNYFNAGVIAACLCMVCPAFADGTVVLPGFVVKDNNGSPIGPVVAVAGRDSPVVRMLDSTNNVPVFVEVRHATALVVTDERTFFSMADCTGTAYHEVPSQAQGLDAITGFMHSVARIGTMPAGNQQLFASSTSDTGASTMYSSQYLNDACSPSSSDTRTLREATSVMDIDAAHPTPYTGGP